MKLKKIKNREYCQKYRNKKEKEQSKSKSSFFKSKYKQGNGSCGVLIIIAFILLFVVGYCLPTKNNIFTVSEDIYKSLEPLQKEEKITPLFEEQVHFDSLQWNHKQDDFPDELKFWQLYRPTTEVTLLE